MSKLNPYGHRAAKTALNQSDIFWFDRVGGGQPFQVSLASLAAAANLGQYVAAKQGLTDAGAVSLVTYKTDLTTTGAAAITLADGTFVGQRKLIQMIVDVGDATLTPVNFANGTTITFADVGDIAELLWDGTNWNAINVANIVDGATAPAIA